MPILNVHGSKSVMVQRLPSTIPNAIDVRALVAELVPGVCYITAVFFGLYDFINHTIVSRIIISKCLKIVWASISDSIYCTLFTCCN